MVMELLPQGLGVLSRAGSPSTATVVLYTLHNLLEIFCCLWRPCCYKPFTLDMSRDKFLTELTLLPCKCALLNSSFRVCRIAGRLRGITSFSDMVFGVLREVQRINLVIQLRYVLSKLLPATPIEVLLAVVHSPLRKDDDDQHMTEAVLRGYARLADIEAADSEAKVSSEHCI